MTTLIALSLLCGTLQTCKPTKENSKVRLNTERKRTQNWKAKKERVNEACASLKGCIIVWINNSDSSSWLGTLWSLSDGETLKQDPIPALIDHYQPHIHTKQRTEWDAVKLTHSERDIGRGKKPQKGHGQEFEVCALKTWEKKNRIIQRQKNTPSVEQMWCEIA